ncbi:MAG: tetratricopeptide repeat protein [Gammaproteobacteria bacterium]
MKPLIPLVVLFLSACAAPGPGPGDADGLAPEFGQPGEAGYHLFMAETALQRDQPALAATEYLRAARLSEDPSVAERATRIASAFGTRAEGLEAAQRWATLAPDDLHPRRFLVRLHLEDRDVERAVAELGFLRNAAGYADRAFLPLLPLVAEAPDRGIALDALAAVVDDYPDDASGAYVQAYLALGAGDVALAEAEAERAVALDLAWTEAAVLYARAIAAAGRVDEAIEWLAGRPEAAELPMQLERAVLLMSADRTVEARGTLERILAANPADPDVLRALGFLEYFDGNAEAARAAFMALLDTGRFANDALFYLGGIAEQQGEIEEAARLYSRISGGENLVTAQVRLALLMFRMGRPELAINHLELFAERKPDAAGELGAARAELLVRLGLPEDAVAVYDELLAQYPDDAGIRYARGMLHVELGQVDAAVADFEQVVAMYPDDPSALNALGYTLTDMTDRHDEALPLIQRALELEPDNPAILDSMGWVLFRLGRPEDALPYIESAWALQKDEEIGAHLGEVLWGLGRIDEARDVWLEAIIEFPGSQVLLDTMGRLDP